MRRDDGAGLLEITELERDGGPNDDILPVIGDRQTPHPFGPIVSCAVGEFAAGRREICRERLIGSHHEIDRPGQHERRFSVDVGQRRVGRESDDDIGPAEGDVIAADRFERHRDSVSAGRPETNGYPGHSGDWLDDSDQLRWTEGPVIRTKSRRKIGNLDRSALAIGQDGRNDGGVAQIVGRKVDHAVQNDVAKALFLIARQQPAKYRVAVEAREAPPDEPRRRLHQSGRTAVTDDRQIEPEVVHCRLFPSRPQSRASQQRTSRGELNVPFAPLMSRSTE
jgi:hypothetical protein